MTRYAIIVYDVSEGWFHFQIWTVLVKCQLRDNLGSFASLIISSILNRCKLLGKDKNLCKPKFFSKRKMYPGVKQKKCNLLSSIEVTFQHKLLAKLHHSRLEKTSSYLVCTGESFMPLSSPP
jgi:hypothetical protein